MYSAADASRVSHASNNDSKVIKSLGEVAGSVAVEDDFRNRVGVDLGRLSDGESFKCVACDNA